MFPRPGLAAAVLIVLALGAPAFAQAPAAAKPAGTTVNIQGNDQQSWINDPHWHAYYDLTKAAFAQGPGKVDVADFERQSFALFRDFAVKRGVDPAHMQDHLKLIPRQVVQIVKEDPKVLDSYQNFVEATFGPQ